MPSKRPRVPGLSDGTEVPSQFNEPKTPTKSKATTPKGSRTPPSSKSSKIAARTTPKAKLKQKPVNNRIIVGVDFGTTNSGIAHVMSLNGDAQDVEVIKSWPDGNEELEKVPTRISFTDDGDGGKVVKWGFEVLPGERSYTWFKLHLDANAERTLFDSEELTGKMGADLSRLPADMTAEEVTVAYLSKLFAHTMEMLEKYYTVNIIKATPIDFWVTVPATWQESAVDATRTAAEEAGLGSRDSDRLNIITEPEAGAIAVLSTAVEKNPELIKPEMNVLICDLGGGTLDFQVLTIKDVIPRLETEETIPGMGGKAGSAYIDCKFHDWAGLVFGDAFKRMPKEKIGPGSRLMREWEIQKKAFNGNDLTKPVRVQFPALIAALRERGITSTSYDSDDHCIEIPGIDVAEMFEGSIRAAFAIVDELAARLEKEKLQIFQIMCLCGGLGSSAYVWKRFQQYVKDRLDGNCAIFTDKQAWSAVVRGAAIRGLSGSLVLSKRAKRAYGIAIHQAFREGIDDEDDAEMCPVKGKRAHGYMYWPIEVGLRFTENMRIRTNLYVTVPADADDDDLQFKWKLYSCGLPILPDREDHDNVKKEGSIMLDLRRSYKRTRRNDGSHDGHEAIKIAIVFKMGSERGTLVVEALHGTKVVGTAKIDYARTHARQIVSQSAGLLDS